MTVSDDLLEQLTDFLACGIADCDKACELNSWDRFIVSSLHKGRLALPLAIASSAASSLVSFAFYKWTPWFSAKEKSAVKKEPQNRIVKVMNAASRSVVGSSVGFSSKVAINMISQSSDLTVNLGSRVVADASTKKVAEYIPYFTGPNKDSWAYTITKAGTSAVVSTVTYNVTSHYLQMPPIVARFVSAGTSAASEQIFEYAFKPRK